MGPSERFLVWRLRRGDPDACRELIRRHHSPVYGYLRRLGADGGLAEDLTQETYARAWQSIRSLRRAASLRSWLLTIARNEYFQRLRGERGDAASLEGVSDREDPEPDAEVGLMRDERRRAVRRAVARLDPVLQETVALHYFQGLSLREAGAVLGIPAGTVKSRVHRALERLQGLLDSPEASHGSERAGKAVAGRS